MYRAIIITPILSPPKKTSGKCVDVCKVHAGGPFCVSSIALQNYLASDEKVVYLGNSKAAIELNCSATKDRRGIKPFGTAAPAGGSNCARYLRTQQPYTYFRMGKDETWKKDGQIDFVKKMDK